MKKTSPSEFDLFTGGPLSKVPHSKTADFVIYYNIAISNMEKMLRHYEKGKDIKLTDITEKETPFDDHTYRIFTDYLWREYTLARNDNDYKLKAGHKEVVHRLFRKLNDIRNYQSHIWHDNAALIFDKTLCDFITQKYKRAIEAAGEQHHHETAEFEEKMKKFPIFKEHKDNNYITDEGKVFFLSFFLTTGQMSRLLQQRKGSKRTDLPLYRVKHIIYKYYCHRDGASILGFHHDEDILADMEQQEHRDIMKARLAYKLVTYLYDYPDYLAASDTMPLLTPSPDGKSRLKKIETVQELLSYMMERGILANFDFSVIVPDKNKEVADLNMADSKEEYERNRTLALTHQNIPGYEFHMGFESLCKLVLLCIRYGEDEVVSRLKAAMQKQAAHRSRLYDILQRNLSDLPIEDHEYLTDRSKQYLRGYRILTEKGIVFFEKYGKDKKIPAGQIQALSDRIRPLNIPYKGKTKVEPIILYAHDFIEKTEQKFRAGNRFVFYAAKYLMDFQIAENWYWEAEKFTPEKTKEFQRVINEKENWRLSIEDDHVTIAIPKDDSYDKDTIQRAKKDEPQPMYQFSLGSRALRYLLAMHFLQKTDGNLNDLLTNALKKDFDLLTNNEWPGKEFHLLEEKFLPTYLKPNNNEDLSRQVAKIKTRYQQICHRWEHALAHIRFLKRAEKNKLIMDAYRLFDWTIDNKGVKFLRKNEYNELSVCHYSRGDKKKFNYLYNRLFQLNTRKPPLPADVVAILQQADSLDELLIKVTEDRKNFLAAEVNAIELLPPSPRKKKIIKLSRLLGISVPPLLLNDQAKEELNTRRKKTLDVLPFSVHPVLILKHFKHHSYIQEYRNTKGVSRQENDVFRLLRTPSYTGSLHGGHYNLSFLDQLFPTSEDQEINAAYNREQHKWRGIINTCHTEDALLWQIALQYLKDNRHTRQMAEMLHLKGSKPKVGNLHAAEIAIPLKKGKGKQNEDDIYPGDLWMTIKMHQLDDVMFASDKESLRRAACHYLCRNDRERDYWDTQPDYLVPEKDTVPLYTFSDNSGSIKNPIPYSVLREEMQLVAQHGLYLAGYLLDWERGVLNKRTKDKADKQAFMKEMEKEKDQIYNYTSFNRIISLTGEAMEEVTKAQLSDYRNKAFHNGIPLIASYSYWARPFGPAGSLLGVTEPLHWSKDKKKYVVGSD